MTLITYSYLLSSKLLPPPLTVYSTPFYLQLTESRPLSALFVFPQSKYRIFIWTHHLAVATICTRTRALGLSRHGAESKSAVHLHAQSAHNHSARTAHKPRHASSVYEDVSPNSGLNIFCCCQLISSPSINCGMDSFLVHAKSINIFLNLGKIITAKYKFKS